MHPELAELHRRISNLIRQGTVTAVKKGYCRVKTGELETNWRPYCTVRAGKAKRHWRPSVGESVLLLSPSGDLAGAYVGPSLFCEANAVPTDEENTEYTIYDDGAVIAYNPDTGKLQAVGIKKVQVEASESAYVKSPDITLDGNVKVTGTLTAQSGGQLTGDFSHNGKFTNTGGVTADGVSLKTHKHLGVTSGSAQSGIPA